MCCNIVVLFGGYKYASFPTFFSVSSIDLIRENTCYISWFIYLPQAITFVIINFLFVMKRFFLAIIVGECHLNHQSVSFQA